MGIHKAVYVRDSDLDVWKAAAAEARKRRMNMSAFVLTALDVYRKLGWTDPNPDDEE